MSFFPMMPHRVLCLLLITGSAFGGPAVGNHGYQFVEGFSHTTIPFQKYQDLIVIQAQMNDSIKLNLILDTGTRSLLLYGRKFRRLQNLRKDKRVRVTGWGTPESVDATLSFPNTIRLGEIRGDQLGVAIVENGRMLPDAPTIDGIIGYELFARFAVEINYSTRTIHLYDHLPEGHTLDFIALPLEVNRARPQITSRITLLNNRTIDLKLLIDTGSSLGLAVFSTSRDGFSSSEWLNPIGRGLTGPVLGYDLFVKEFLLGSMRVGGVPTHLVEVPAHPDEQFTFSGSLGASFLREHIVIFDYARNTFFISRRQVG
jgi:hypothetical protein